MTSWKYITIIAILGLSFQSCDPLPELENFDAEAWKSDPKACAGKREALIDNLASQKDKLMGLGQNQVLKILGKPDIQELYARNQRFYIYFYLSGPQCNEADADINQGGLVRIRFNAIDQMTEFVWQK